MQFARARTFCLRAEMYAREHGVLFRTELDFMLAGTSVPTAPVHLVMRFVAADACYLSTTQTVTPDGGRGGDITSCRSGWKKMAQRNPQNLLSEIHEQMTYLPTDLITYRLTDQPRKKERPNDRLTRPTK